VFALLAFGAMAIVGFVLYRQLEAQLVVRDDGALVTRVDQIRSLMRQVDVHDLIRENPRLFANMLGNTESLLVVRPQGEAPLLVVNPGHTAVPDAVPVPSDAPLSLGAVHHVTQKDGTPFIYVAAAAQGAPGQPDLQIVSGRLMTTRTKMLADYRNQILLFASLAAAGAALLAYGLARRGMKPLQRLAAQTASIGVGNLSTRIEQRDAPPELDALIGAFNGMLDRLERSFTQLKQVSADMAHDLRTPISNLLGQTEVGLNQTRDAAYYQRLLGSNFEEQHAFSRARGARRSCDRTQGVAGRRRAHAHRRLFRGSRRRSQRPSRMARRRHGVRRCAAAAPRARQSAGQCGALRGARHGDHDDRRAARGRHCAAYREPRPDDCAAPPRTALRPVLSCGCVKAAVVGVERAWAVDRAQHHAVARRKLAGRERRGRDALYAGVSARSAHGPS
jgi:HAMP domain-containing protein